MAAGLPVAADLGPSPKRDLPEQEVTIHHHHHLKTFQFSTSAAKALFQLLVLNHTEKEYKH
jgi:hypothetical protein